MTEDVHIRAEQLLLRARVEGLADAEREWLERHLETCAACVARAESLDHAVRALRSTQMEMNPALAGTTRLRVRLRARELCRLLALRRRDRALRLARL
jgi:anti-sigma factor RsiW